MKTVDLSKKLLRYKKGWVAVNKKFQVVAHSSSFDTISKKISHKPDLTLMPISHDFSGLVTRFYG